MKQTLIAALRTILGSHFNSKELNQFIELVEGHEEWMGQTEYKVIEYLSEDEDWDTISPEVKKERISDEINYWKREDEYGDTSTMYFKDIQFLPRDTWAIHRTKADPLKVIKNFKGCKPENVGLTKLHGCEPGSLAFAYGLDVPVKETSVYGKNGILVRMGEAVQVEHVTDKPSTQIIFDITEINEAYPFIDKGKNFELYMDKEVATLRKTPDAFSEFIRKKAN